MNEINAFTLKSVSLLKGSWNWTKIKIVTAAEAEAEKKDRLHGVGIAEHGRIFCWWFGDSIKKGEKGANVELTEEQIMSILLTNQCLDTLNICR